MWSYFYSPIDAQSRRSLERFNPSVDFYQGELNEFGDRDCRHLKVFPNGAPAYYRIFEFQEECADSTPTVDYYAPYYLRIDKRLPGTAPVSNIPVGRWAEGFIPNLGEYSTTILHSVSHYSDGQKYCPTKHHLIVSGGIIYAYESVVTYSGDYTVLEISVFSVAISSLHAIARHLNQHPLYDMVLHGYYDATRTYYGPYVRVIDRTKYVRYNMGRIKEWHKQSPSEIDRIVQLNVDYVHNQVKAKWSSLSVERVLPGYLCLTDTTIEQVVSPKPDAVWDMVQSYLPDRKKIRAAADDALLQAALNPQYLELNTIALAGDLIRLKEDILSLVKLVKGKASVKSVADLFLSARFGLKLTIQDLTELCESVKGASTEASKWKHPWKTARGVATLSSEVHRCIVTSTVHQKLYYEDPEGVILNTIKSAMDWDFWPSLGNMWDLIPYSFVVDWIVGFGDLFERLDAYAYFQYLEILSNIRSEKHQIKNLPSSALYDTGPGRAVTGTVEISLYTRTSFPTCEPPPAFAWPEFDVPHGASWLDAIAMIVQRKS